jgi:hypothetical protein
MRLKSMKYRIMAHCDAYLLIWLGVKLLVDSAGFIYLLWRLSHPVQ